MKHIFNVIIITWTENLPTALSHIIYVSNAYYISLKLFYFTVYKCAPIDKSQTMSVR